jgi:anti-anti-sigma factor
MKIRKDKEGELLVLRPVGRLDSENSPSFEKAVEEAVGKGDKNIIVDMSEVNYISSRGLRAFLTGAKCAQAAGGKLVACSSQEAVQKVFDMTGVATILGIFGTAEEATRAFDTQPGGGADADSR